MNEDPFIFSEKNLLKQLRAENFTKGFFKVKFFTKDGFLSNTKTDVISDFYLYPSSGTLRDKNFNIVIYSSKFDVYRGFDFQQYLKSK